MADQDTPTEPEPTGEACYCQGFSTDPDLIQCEGCNAWYHMGCLKAGRPSPLHGDVFFSLKCINCNLQGPEECKRKKLSWLHVIWLSLYNLQRSNSGKHGYFHWKHHISIFIQSNWTVFFGSARKKSNLWLGTVAGVLSSNSPEYFSSGAKEIGETGYWKLADRKPPPLTQGQLYCTQLEAFDSQLKKGALYCDLNLKDWNLDSGSSGHDSDLEEVDRTKTAWQTLGGSKRKRKSATIIPVCTTVQQEMHSTRPRRSGGSTLKAAMELKAKQSEIATSTKRRRKTEPAVSKKDNTDSCPVVYQTSAQPEIAVPSCSEPADELSDFERTNTNPVPVSGITVKVETAIQEDTFIKREPLDELIPIQHFESDDDLEVDPCALSPDTHGGPLIYDPLPSVDDLIAGLPSSASVEAEASEDTAVSMEMHPIKEEPPEEPSISEDEEEDEAVTASPQQQPHPAVNDGDQGAVSSSVESESSSSSDEDEVEDAEHEAQKRRRKMMGMRAEEDEENKPKPVRCVPLSLYEEQMLLKKIRLLADVAPPGDIRFNQLKRKLIVRQQKRDHNRKVFDLDAAVNKFIEDQGYLRQEMPNQMSSPSKINRGQQVLDRYQTGIYAPGAGGQYVSFMTRLVGTEEDQLNSIISPYTSRVLKPFIRRDYDCRPPKLRLLAEIRAYPHRNDPTWKPPPTAPLDYCYVRPQHIPSINALCREFFWPGIDLSECLQYPDFSCVVLYRKLVVGFAFMVPDVKYNEAYISFIFSRPEWRGAGMATFMLYHLIQTCMGKDVTLHVSATNTAMLLYQKFGFKPEEFILDFYDKYFPVESTECRHAFFLRLRR